MYGARGRPSPSPHFIICWCAYPQPALFGDELRDVLEKPLLLVVTLQGAEDTAGLVFKIVTERNAS